MKAKKTYFNIILFAVLVIYSFHTGTAQSALNISIDSITQKALKELKGIPGLAIAVVENDCIVHLKSYGLADVEQNISSTINTPYYIASTTKSFTATLAQILHSEHIVNIDIPIINYKPIKNFENKEVFENITLRDLLTHTSGISNGYLVWRNAVSGQYNQNQIIDILENYTSPLDNNRNFKYDNLGYNIFDIILQEEFGLNWKKLLEEKLFQPLGMTHTTAFYNKVIEENWSVAQPYIAIGDVTKPTRANSKKDNKTMHAAGGLYSSAQDIANWLMFYVNKGNYKGSQLYDQRILEEIQKPYAEVKTKGTIFKENGYGMGWHTATIDSQKVLYHNGGFLGHSAKISFMPDKKVGVAVFVNESFYGDNIADILTSFTFNYFINKSTTIDSYLEEIEALKDKVSSMNTSYSSSLSETRERESSLTLDASKYEGEYVNEGFGIINVSKSGEKLNLEMGLLQAIAIPGLEKNSILVEFSGPGSKSDIIFIINGNDVNAILFKGLEFIKKIP